MQNVFPHPDVENYLFPRPQRASVPETEFRLGGEKPYAFVCFIYRTRSRWNRVASEIFTLLINET